ncbi:hypothetical protein SKAU_G00402050 [Synaphobranchus kaupii]|uniref:Uncharacterized protein n=1 Tax=Synaphobranchus kaupii TaxID=118154 RepID=A0A9Q1E9B3_SYNKA|nr:hypothetical protein SKAU_G00402050 [Synaphobranchus kaupii]
MNAWAPFILPRASSAPRPALCQAPVADGARCAANGDTHAAVIKAAGRGRGGGPRNATSIHPSRSPTPLIIITANDHGTLLREPACPSSRLSPLSIL